MLRLGVPLIVSFLLGLVMTRANAAPPEADPASVAPSTTAELRPTYQLQPIGWVRKTDGRTTIELYEEYRPALLGVDALDSIWVLYWFDRNDSPAQRDILQVHPRGNPNNPLRGVFATRAPVRPNLIAMSRCRVLAVEGNVIVIDEIDAFADTPVLDIKP
jgi:tRNA-Thr(GGU) m(6)t(6)A37 methyltransferase TsaA